MRLLLLCLLAGLNPLVGCSTDHGTFSPLSTEVVMKPHVFGKLDNKKLVCADETACPVSVGQLVTVTPRGRETCTFTLVRPDVILTASHCLPWGSVANDQSIIGNCWVRFPELAHESTSDPLLEPIACKRVLKASELDWRKDDQVQEDYAYIELARPTARLSLSHEDEMSESERVIVFGVNPASLDNKQDELVKLECKRKKAYRLFTRRIVSESTVVLPDCPIRHGNSGGPILDPSTLRILGVVSFFETKPGQPITAVGTRPADADLF